MDRHLTTWLLLMRASRARLAKAWDQGAMSAAYGEKAAAHYGEKYTAADALRNRVAGIRESWSGPAANDALIAAQATRSTSR